MVQKMSEKKSDGSVLLVSNNGKKFLVKDTEKDYHSQYGMIKKEDLMKNNGSELKTNKDVSLFLIKPSFIDLFSKIKRGAQIIPSKDVGFIISETGIGKNSIVVDAGAGSGGLCLVLANIAKKVYSFDIREDHIEIVKKNKELLGLKNLEIKEGNIYQDKLPKNIDVVTLDVPEPWLAIENVMKYLSSGGFIVSYSPTIPQVSDLVDSVSNRKGIVHLKTIEIIEREWEILGRKVRPKTQQRISHSGFLTFLRKIN